VPSSGTVSPGTQQSASHTFNSAGTFTISVTATDNGNPARTSAAGTHNQVVQTPGAGDCGTGGDAGNDFASATTISLPRSCSGVLGTSDSQDWYQFFVSAGQTIHADMTPNAASDFDMCLYRPSESATAVDCSAALTGLPENIDWTATESGNWRLRIYIFAGTGSYTMAVST
jgi:PKD repeat protein